MKPRSRICKAWKWGTVTLALLLSGIYIASGWWFLECGEPVPEGQPQWFAFVGRGQIGLGHQRCPGAMFRTGDGIFLDPLDQPGFLFWFQWTRRPSDWFAGVPLWLFVLPIGTAAAVAIRLDHRARRRARLDLCNHCHYDRAGLAAGGKCPECGTVAVSV